MNTLLSDFHKEMYDHAYTSISARNRSDSFWWFLTAYFKVNGYTFFSANI